jgi:hypothetical protein
MITSINITNTSKMFVCCYDKYRLCVLNSKSLNCVPLYLLHSMDLHKFAWKPTYFDLIISFYSNTHYISTFLTRYTALSHSLKWLGWNPTPAALPALPRPFVVIGAATRSMCGRNKSGNRAPPHTSSSPLISSPSHFLWRMATDMKLPPTIRN